MDVDKIKHTLASKDARKVPQLGHVESLKDLTLVGSTVTVQRQGDVLLVLVLLGKGNAGTDGDLGTDNTVTTVEAGGEHMHGTTLAVGNTLSSAEQLTNDGLDRGAAHHGETVAAVGGNDVVLLGDGVLDADGDGLLTGRQVAETADLLLLVQSVGGHLHAAHGNHVVVHLLQLGLCGLEGEVGRVELVRLEALVRELDLEGLVILLDGGQQTADWQSRQESYAGDVFLLGVGAGGVGGDGPQHLRSDADGLQGSTSDGRGEGPRRESGQHDGGCEEEKGSEEEGADNLWSSRLLGLELLAGARVSSKSAPAPLVSCFGPVCRAVPRLPFPIH